LEHDVMAFYNLLMLVVNTCQVVGMVESHIIK